MKDNEPAFPITEANGANSGMPGMTLRDYFAAEAMRSLIEKTELLVQATIEGGSVYGVDENLLEKHRCGICSSAYAYADKMLEARKEQV